MFETNLKKISKEYNKYVIVIIVALIMMSISICVILNINAISDNTTNYVKVDKFEKTREDFILGTYKYKTKHYYKINGNEYVCEKTLIVKYRTPSKDEEIYIKDFNKPEKCLDSDTLGLYLVWFVPIIPIGILFIGLSLVNYKPEKERLKSVKYLLNNGILVKNAPYYRNVIKRKRNDDPIIETVIHVKSTSGEYIRFLADYEITEFLAKGGTIDIIYDPDNYENYYTAKEINRIGGNRESDYQQTTEEELEKLKRCNLEEEIIYYTNKEKVEKNIKVIKKCLKLIRRKK